MKIHLLKWLMAGGLILASLAGCSGGGGSSAPKLSPGNTVITGTASAGIIYPGTVNVYAVGADGVKGMLLATETTLIDGTYRAPLGGYSGAIQVEASGTYTDEETGHIVTIPSNKPLHSMVDKVNETTDNNRIVSVTLLTELAWRKATTSGTLPATPAAMLSANKLLKDLFKISDIIGIEPVRPDNATMANASQESQAYSLVLAVLSKLASAASGTTDLQRMESILTSMYTEVIYAETNGKMNPLTISALSGALASLSLGNDFPSARLQLAEMGKKSQLITLTVAGSLPTGTNIYAIQGTITLPVDTLTNNPKVSVRSDFDGRTLPDVMLLTGVAESIGGSSLIANYLSTQQQVHFGLVLDGGKAGIGAGDFATFSYDVVTGATVTAADFSLLGGSVSITDANGVAISGVTVTIK